MPDNIDAAFVWKENSAIYFFKGDEYWKWMMTADAAAAGYPKDTPSLWAFPGSLEASQQKPQWEKSVDTKFAFYIEALNHLNYAHSKNWGGIATSTPEFGKYVAALKKCGTALSDYGVPIAHCSFTEQETAYICSNSAHKQKLVEWANIANSWTQWASQDHYYGAKMHFLASELRKELQKFPCIPIY